jgi:hypothetical protein
MWYDHQQQQRKWKENIFRHYMDTEIRQIYYCKSYLEVKRISDLCTADGLFVLPSIAKRRTEYKTMRIKDRGHTAGKTGGVQMVNMEKILKHDMQRRKEKQ